MVYMVALLGCCAWLEVQEQSTKTVGELIEKLRSDLALAFPVAFRRIQDG